MLSILILIIAMSCGMSAVAAESVADPDDVNRNGIDDDVEDTPNKAKLWLGLGMYYPSLDTKVSVGLIEGPVGAWVDFESNLGMRDVALMPILNGSYRFNSRHRVNFGYFNLRRNGSERSDVTFRFGGIEVKASLPVQTYFDVKSYSASYGYSVYTSDKVDLELSVGLSVQDIAFGLATTGNLEEQREESDLLAPLPTIGMSGFYALSDKWLLNGRAGYFAVDMNWEDRDRDLGGTILDISAGVTHKTFKNIGFGLSWEYFDVNLDYRKSRKNVSLDYTYSGPTFSIFAYF